jgi:hypothetical protein
MKKLFSVEGLKILILTISFFSCEKATDDPAMLLIGEWNQVSQRTIQYVDNLETSDETNTYKTGDYVLKVLSNGTAEKYKNGNLFDAFYWSTDGDLMKMTTGNGVEVKAEFTVDDKAFTLKWAVEATAIDGHKFRSEYKSVYSRI